MLDIDQNIIILVVIAIFSGGLVKGTLGVGMPMLAVPIIAFVLPPTKAMILLCFPILCSRGCLFKMTLVVYIGLC